MERTEGEVGSGSGSGVLPAASRRLLETVGLGITAEETARTLRLPASRVQAALQAAAMAGLLCDDLGVYRLTPVGADALRRSGAVTPMVPGSG